MAIPLRNIIHDKIKASGSLTDEDLQKVLTKDKMVIPQDRLNKTLMDLEIMGAIAVTWFTKDMRKIEVLDMPEDVHEAENMRLREKEYEASFPRADI